MNERSFKNMARPADADKRRKILESAFQVFGKKGFESSTMKSIAREAGIAPGSIYTYFRDKQDLFHSTAREIWDRLLSRFRSVVASPRGIEEKLAELLDVGFSALKASLPLLRGMLFEAAQDRMFQENLDALCGYISALLAQGRREGILEVPEDEGQWKRIVRVTVVGIIFSAALAQQKDTDGEIAALKAAITRMLADRFVAKRGKAK
jgi:AcrR family transcriptional regulator